MSETMALFIARSAFGVAATDPKSGSLRTIRRRMDAAVPGWRETALGDRPEAAIVLMLPAPLGPFVELVVACNPESPSA